MGLATLFGFGSLGLLIIYYFQGLDVSYLVQYGSGWMYQVYRGLLFGLIAALNMLWLINTPLLKDSRNFFTRIIQGADLRLIDLIFLSLAAGIGEELFFRGGLQPYLGIWLTAFVFIVLHGYINPFDWQMSLYGVLMIVISAGLGYLFEYIGLFAAISAHFIIDLILFIKFRYYVKEPIGKE